MATKLGSQKPTNSVVIPYKKSRGGEAVDLYEKTGRKAQKWQKDLLNDIMGETEDGLWSHTRFGFAVPRQNGKNEVVAIRELWGLVNGEYMCHTAHRTKTSHAAWERLVQLLDDAKIPYRSIRAEGRENIVLKKGKGKIDFRTRSAKGGLGLGYDAVFIDEAQEYTDDQESVLKYVVAARENPQTIFCGTPPTPLSSGTVFTKYREQTLQGQKRNAGWWSWEVPDETDPEDTEAWYKTNPSLGTILTERVIYDEIGDDIIDFNIQRLGLWLRYNQKSAILKSEWERLQLTKKPKIGGPLAVGIKYGHDGTNVSLGVAVKTTDGKTFIEAVDCKSRREGNAWIVDFIKKANPGVIVIDGASGQNILAQELKNAKVQLKPILPTVKEIINANSMFEVDLTRGGLCHMGQPALSQSVTNVDKRVIGNNGGFGYQSQNEQIEVSLLESVILASWGLGEYKPVRIQRISY